MSNRYADSHTMIIALCCADGIYCCTDSKMVSVVDDDDVVFVEGGKYYHFGRYSMMFAGSGYRRVALTDYLYSEVVAQRLGENLEELARAAHNFFQAQNVEDEDVDEEDMEAVFVGYEDGEHKIFVVDTAEPDLVETNVYMGGSGSDYLFSNDLNIPFHDLSLLSGADARKGCLIAVHRAVERDEDNCGGDKWLLRINGPNTELERVDKDDVSFLD